MAFVLRRRGSGCEGESTERKEPRTRSKTCSDSEGNNDWLPEPLALRPTPENDDAVLRQSWIKQPRCRVRTTAHADAERRRDETRTEQKHQNDIKIREA